MPDVRPLYLCYTEHNGIGGRDRRSCWPVPGRVSEKGWCLVVGESRTRILVADSDSRVRMALHTLLKQEPEQVAVRESTDVSSLTVQVKQFKPDLLLLDWDLPGRPAAALLFALNGLNYHLKVIVLSTRPESEREVLGAGADAFVCKGDPPDQLLGSFRRLVKEAKAAETVC
jgi:DNA-binding NarL/FixJ family response regulator